MTDLPDFDAFVDLYEREAEPLTAPYAEKALALAALPAGARLIDVGAGTGACAVRAARAGARVLAVDLAPAMVARLSARLRPYDGCEAREMGADALQAADAVFDAAISVFAAAILPIWREAFAEMVRVTRPGGRVAVTAWPSRYGAGPQLVLKGVFERLFPDRAFPAALPGWSRDSLAAALSDAGLVDLAVDRLATMHVKPTAKQAVEDSLPLFRMMPAVKALSQAEADRLREPLNHAFVSFAAADGSVHLPIEGFVAVGTKL